MMDPQIVNQRHDYQKAADQPKERPTRVLLIEDNQGFAYYIRDILVRKLPGQFKLLEAAELAAGLALLDAEQVDVVLLDLGLPDSNGYDTFRKTRDRAPETPVVILTVLNDEPMAMKSMRHGAQDYLVKDQVDENLLIRSIRYAVERAHADAAVRHLSGRILQSQGEERRRIARGLHDTTAQTMAALAINLSLLKTLAPDLRPEPASLLADSIACADKCANELRTMSYLLHPPLLDELGLAGAVRDYADGFSERSGIRADLELPPHLGRLPKEVETALFRVMQESLTNIHRHSGSKTASIRLSKANGAIQFDISDAGCGIAPDNMLESDAPMAGVGVGIAGMRERLRQLGGTLEIETDTEGTRVSARLPL